MNESTIDRVIRQVHQTDNPYGIYIRYRGCGRHYPHGDGRPSDVLMVYDFIISGGFDYVLSVGTQARYGKPNDESRTVFRIRDARSHLAGNIDDHREGPQQWMNMSIQGIWNFHIFQVALSLGHHILQSIYEEDLSQGLDR